MSSLMQWEEIYCFQKFLPLLTRWQLFHYGSANQDFPLKGNVWPHFIKKKRAPKGIPSYEIVWKDEQNCFTGLIPDEQMEAFLNKENNKDATELLQSMWSTIEPIDLVEKAYPELVETFLQTKAKKPKETKRAQGKTKTTSEEPRNGKKRTKKAVDSSLNDMSALQQVLDELEAKVDGTNRSDKKAVPRKKKKSKSPKNVQTIEKFFVSKTVKSSACKGNRYESPKIKTCPAPLSLSHFGEHDWEDSRLTDNIENLSEIIDDLVSQASNVNEFCGKKLRFDEFEVEMKENFEQNCDQHFDQLELEFNADCEQKCHDQENEMIEMDAKDKESSFDEFDFIVMNKPMPKPVIPKLIKEQTATSILSSTPIMVDRFLTRQIRTKIVNTPKQTMENSIIENNNTILVTSFFIEESHSTNNNIDLFEQSIDFKNMEDVVTDEEDTDSDDSGSNSPGKEIEENSAENDSSENL